VNGCRVGSMAGGGGGRRMGVWLKRGMGAMSRWMGMAGHRPVVRN
jgi:hypothetical protein